MGKEDIRVAIVGAGRIAGSIDDEIVENDTWPSLKDQLPYCHAACYREVGGVEIVAACDEVEEQCKTFCKRWDVPRYYLDYREMIEEQKPDIVSVCTGAGTFEDKIGRHAEISVFAMEHGARGIYCEKPMCNSLVEADMIVDCVRKHGVKFILGAQRRYSTNFRKMREMVVSGELGELVGVTSRITCLLLHTHSHMADTCLYLAGDARPVSVFGVLGPRRATSYEERALAEHPNPKYDKSINRWRGDPTCPTYTVQLESGVMIHHLPAATDFRFEVVCVNGYMRNVDNNDAIHVYKRRGRSYSFDPVKVSSERPGSMSLNLVRDLAGCVRDGGTPLADETAGLYGMEILMGVAQSHLEGRLVELPLANREMFIPSH